MAEKKKWRKRQSTRCDDYWRCPWCGKANSADISYAGDYDKWEMGTVQECPECGRYSKVFLIPSFYSEPADGPEEEDDDE